MSRRGLALRVSLSVFFLFFMPGCSGKVKEPAVAGYFYPADKGGLIETVDGFLSSADYTPGDGRLTALISPHAGYRFSGAVAAYTYGHLKERDIKTVILIGPSHHKSFKGASVYKKGGMRTPLGTIKIDGTIAGSLINKEADVTFYPDAFEKEHSLEVQLPFLQRVLKDFKIVPILVGAPTGKSFEFLTNRLTEILRDNEHAILIASTDLSHYHDYETAVKMDGKTLDAVERMSVEDVRKYLMSGEGEMCGGYPIIVTMAVARNLGATHGVVYKYANSGDVTGDKARVVGYAAVGLYRNGLTKEQKEELLALARKTVIGYVENGDTPDPEIKDKRLRANGAAFVTIKTWRGMLRGCIGNIVPVMPLYRAVIRNAVSACSRDPRFPPVKKDELKNGMEVEVTVLSPLVPLKDTGTIEIGKHGLYLVKGAHRGILLPQVPVEFGWDGDTFLKQVSLKAGLPEEAWKSAHLFSFTADIIKSYIFPTQDAALSSKE